MEPTADAVPAAGTRAASRHGPHTVEIERRRWAPVVAAGTVRCRVCHGLIDPAARWNFGQCGDVAGGPHTPEHRRCNDGVAGRGITPAA